MRVPGNERAFTVSPARGIPFPQLVCIGARGGQSQAFPVSGWAWPPAALRQWARAPPRATVRGPAGTRWQPPAPAPPRAHSHTHARTHARYHLAPSPTQAQTPPRRAATRGVVLLRSLWVGLRGSGAPPAATGPREPDTGIERPVWSETASFVRRSPGLGTRGRETPCAPWTDAQRPSRGSGTPA